MERMSHEAQHLRYPTGTIVVAEDGEELGTIESIHPHFFLVRHDSAQHKDLQVPAHAIASYDGTRLYLMVNREALSVVDDEASVARRLEGETD
jgi:hypothetical protein